MDEKQKLKSDEEPPSYTTKQPQSGYTPVSAGDQPPDYLWLSVFTLACCFVPVSIIALIYSIQVRSHFFAGRLSEARHASKAAKKFNLLSLCIGIVTIIFIYLVVIVSLTPVWIAIARGNETDEADNSTDFMYM